MILFSPKYKIKEYTHPCIILFGAGLVGKAIAAQIDKYAPYDLKYCKSLWGQPENLQKHGEMIDEAIRIVPSGQTLEIIWSAGKAGFNASEQEAQQEFSEFKEHLELISRAASSAGININFTLFSSAGGIFEGKRLVEDGTTPAPKRFYGHLKLDMEKALEDCSLNLIRIIRLTSVFGYMQANQRRGLIGTLIENGLQGRTTMISGNFDTLRNYVFVEDVALYIIREIFSEMTQDGKSIVLLTGEKSYSIGEIIYLVEQTLKSKLYLQWSLQPTNLAHISYRSQGKLANFKRTALPVAISKIYHNCLL